MSPDAGQGGSLAFSATSFTSGSDAAAPAVQGAADEPKTRAVYKALSHLLRSTETQGRGIGASKRACAAVPLPSCSRRFTGVCTSRWPAALGARTRFCEVRRLDRRATIELPTAAQTWLEYAKVEEERGHFAGQPQDPNGRPALLSVPRGAHAQGHQAPRAHGQARQGARAARKARARAHLTMLAHDP